MELRVLRYFLMVAREENITKAAQLLHITQPTLSRQLMQLEEELGVKLFGRSNHHIILTNDGMLLRRRAQELVDLADKTKRELSSDAKTLTGKIAIGCGESLSMDYLAAQLASFRTAHPMMRYEIHSANADDIKEQLENGLLDFGLFIEPVDIGRYDFIRMPVTEEWGVLVRGDHPLALRETVRSADLIPIPMLITKREMVQTVLSNWLGENGQNLHIAGTYNLIYNAAVMVQNGIGAALCLKLKSHFDNLRFIPLSPPLQTGSVLAWKKHQPSAGAVGRFIEELRNG